MPKRKKRLIERSTDEIIKRLFPKKVREEAKKEAHKRDVKKRSMVK